MRQLLAVMGILGFFVLPLRSESAWPSHVHAVVHHSPVDTSKQVDGLSMKFDTRHINFGDVVQGEIKRSAFRFINSGTEAIEIDLVSSCECTTVDWPVDPIQPGESGEISIVFDSAKKEASETVDVDIILRNTDPKTGHPILEIVQYSYNLLKS